MKYYLANGACIILAILKVFCGKYKKTEIKIYKQHFCINFIFQSIKVCAE